MSITQTADTVVSNKRRRRITAKPKSCPNPLFEKWLEELRAEAAQNDSNMRFVYGKALQSLRIYPLPLVSGKECKILKNFGDSICNLLDKKLAKYREEGGTYLFIYTLSEEGENLAVKLVAADKDDEQAVQDTQPVEYPNEEVTILDNPQFRFRTSGEAFVYLRDTDCDLVAPLSARECNSFLRTSSVTSSFTSMSSFKRFESQSSIRSATTSISRSSSSSNLATAASVVATSCTLYPGEFDVVLCVDTAETSGAQGGGRGTQKDLTLGELQRQGVRYEIRKLNVGDYVWICKPKNSSSQELVLPYVIERKRLDDLGSSIKDGRFKEQKFRLKSCGMSVVYLVEDLPSRQHLGLPESSVLQAIANTHIVDGINVKWTKDIRESIAYLNLMTRQLQVKYQNQVLRNGESLVTFAEFNVQGVKNKPMTVTDLFAKQLLQFSGISADKARAIVDRYPTPSALKAALDRCSSNQEKELLLSSVPYGKTKRMLGPALSKLLAWFYSRSNLE
nr:EOG090X06E6 [Triops cancriformis]